MRKNASAWYAKPSLALLLAPVLMTMGCATSTPQSVAYQPPAPPADLAAPCADLPLIEQGDAQTVALWIVDAVESYKDCQARQSGLVRAWPGITFNQALKRTFFGD